MVIITTLSASTGKLFTVTTQHKHKSRDIKHSEYHQEIRQSQTADKPIAPRGRATQQSRDTRKANLAKQVALFPIKMIAKLEWT